jgi:hypothetical protein
MRLVLAFAPALATCAITTGGVKELPPIAITFRSSVAKVEVYKVAEYLHARDLLRRWRLTEVDLALDPPRPKLGVLAQEECFSEVATLAPDLHAPLSGGEL